MALDLKIKPGQKLLSKHFDLMIFTFCFQGINELDKCHQSQHSTVQSEMKKEMSLLQKRILMDTVRVIINIIVKLKYKFVGVLKYI